jgi:pilus assembly protein CpaB
MKSKAIIPLAIGLVAGVFAIKASMDAVKSAKGATNSEETAVVVAVTDIPVTVAIQPEMLKVARTPKTPLLPGDVFTNPEQLIGRVAQKAIPQGVPILPTMIAPEGTSPGLLTRVKEGYRAVAVKIDESSGVGYLVRPNDWVDVLAVMDIKRGKGSETISRVILQCVQVGAVGQVLGQQKEDGGKQARSVTLIVKEEDVPKLHLAQSRGKITLAMRGNDDAEVSDPAQASESEVLGLADPRKRNQKPAADPSGFSAWFSNMMATAKKNSQAAPPEPPKVAGPQPFAVLVVNNDSQNPAGSDVQRITYRDAESMEVVDVSNEPVGGGTRPPHAQIGAGRGTGRGPTHANRARRARVPDFNPAPDQRHRAVEGESDSAKTEVSEE